MGGKINELDSYQSLLSSTQPEWTGSHGRHGQGHGMEMHPSMADAARIPPAAYLHNRQSGYSHGQTTPSSQGNQSSYSPSTGKMNQTLFRSRMHSSPPPGNQHQHQQYQQPLWKLPQQWDSCHPPIQTTRPQQQPQPQFQPQYREGLKQEQYARAHSTHSSETTSAALSQPQNLKKQRQESTHQAWPVSVLASSSESSVPISTAQILSSSNPTLSSEISASHQAPSREVAQVSPRLSIPKNATTSSNYLAPDPSRRCPPIGYFTVPRPRSVRPGNLPSPLGRPHNPKTSRPQGESAVRHVQPWKFYSPPISYSPVPDASLNSALDSEGHMAPTAHQGTRATVPSSTQFSSVSSISLGSGAPLRSDFYVGGPASAHKLPLSSNGPSSSAVGLGTSADSITPVSMQPPAKVRKLHDGTKQSRTKQRSSLKLEQYVHKSPHRHWVSLRSDLAQRLDPSHAAVKISYDPSTIARDILIIADRHPTERFLNQHLEILRKNLGCVDYSTDLATLRWDDLIDPVVPRDGPTTSLPRPEAHPVNTAPAEITTPAPKPRLTSSGTLPFKPPPYHSRPRDTAISASTTYSPIPPWLSHIVPSVSPICRTPTHSSSVPAPLSPPAPISEPTPESVLASSAPAQTKQAPADTSETDPFEDRRPESRSPQGRLSQVQPTHVRPAPVNLPAVSCNSISNGSNLPPTSRLKASQQTPTPAGPTQPQVVIPPSPHNRMAPKKKPGRPKRDSANLIEVAIPPGPVADRPVTEYQVFPCKWTDCRSELHNLAAIKAHVIKVHIPHHIVCAWQGCQDSTPRAAADMIDHIYRAHISPMAWALGDGPVVSAPVTANNSSTPPPLNPLSRTARPGTMTLPADRDTLKTFSRVHGVQTSKQKASIMKDGGTRWNEEIGPESNHHDFALSNPGRQASSHHLDQAYTPDMEMIV